MTDRATEPTDEEIARNVVRDYAPASSKLRAQMLEFLVGLLSSVRAEEREECAKVADAKAAAHRRGAQEAASPAVREHCHSSAIMAEEIAAAIRETDSDAK